MTDASFAALVVFIIIYALARIFLLPRLQGARVATAAVTAGTRQSSAVIIANARAKARKVFEKAAKVHALIFSRFENPKLEEEFLDYHFLEGLP